MSVTKTKLFSFLSRSGLYSVEEREGRLVISFSSLDLEGVLGGYAEITIEGREEGGKVHLQRVTVVRNGRREEVSVEALEGWLEYIERTEGGTGSAPQS
uniref:Uncharacterized protein n=1 Tax=Thermofilum pendens TaxID=2269 RepID=A0A7C4B9U9_THEPE